MPFLGGRAFSDTAAANGAAAVSTNVAFPACRGLFVGTAGTADLTFNDGSFVAAFPLQAGYNPLSITKAVFGTAAGLIALY